MSSPSPPSPTVVHVPTLMRRIQDADIIVPAFQRRVVWKEAQIIEFLKSVYHGFPVGSVLLWRVEDGAIDPGRIMGPPFPNAKHKDIRHYVLDGQQRLASLFGTLFGADERPAKFRVAFDLRTGVFDLVDSMANSDGWLLLSDLFSPRRFVTTQQRLASLEDGDQLLDKAIALHSVFQEYMLPVVTIAERNVSEVVQIFERINSTGTRLDAVDFMRAVTWSQGFDLNKQTKRIAKVSRESGLDFGAEAIVRVLAVLLGRRPTSEDMLTLRQLNAKELKSGVEAAIQVMPLVCEYFRSELNILSAEFVPYEAQLLVVVSLFAKSNLRPSKQNRRVVARWLLASALNEEFQGKADHRVARIVDSVAALVKGAPHLLEPQLTLNPITLMERRLLRAKALSGGFSLVLSMQKPRSLLTGAPIANEVFLSSSDPEVFAPLLSKAQVGKALRRTPTSAKVLANVVACSDVSEARIIQRLGWHGVVRALNEAVGKAEAAEVLKSQLISGAAAKCADGNDFNGFLRTRAEAIVAVASDWIAQR